jgi:hypothetical protein
MAYEIKGRVKSVGAVEQKTEKFAKRNLVIETDDAKYPQTLQFETSGDRNALLDAVGAGDAVTIQFDLRGREGRDGRVWNTLSVWKLNVDSRGAGHSAPSGSGGGSAQDDIPFGRFR